VSIDPVFWAQQPDPEPTTPAADVVAGLGIGQPDTSLPATSMPDFLKKFGLAGGDLHDVGPLHIPIV
jgi:hypothetical protein